jgi:hypothetical protein
VWPKLRQFYVESVTHRSLVRGRHHVGCKLLYIRGSGHLELLLLRLLQRHDVVEKRVVLIPHFNSGHHFVRHQLGLISLLRKGKGMNIHSNNLPDFLHENLPDLLLLQ